MYADSINDTERETLALVARRPRSPTEVADELGVSVQTASRTLRNLAGEGLVRTVRGSQRPDARGYKLYSATDFAALFANVGGELVDEQLSVGRVERMAISALRIPQSEFRAAVLSYLFQPGADRYREHVEGIAVYGSVARGEAGPDSDVDLLVLLDTDPESVGVRQSVMDRRTVTVGETTRTSVLSKTYMTVDGFEESVAAGSQFLQSVLDEAIVLYDPNEVFRDVRAE